MRVFTSSWKNYGYLSYRLISPILDPIRMAQGIIGYRWYLRDMMLYKLQDPQAKLIGKNLFPILNEKVSFTPFDAHYFYQELWAFQHIRKHAPKKHVDIASKYQFAGFVSTITKCEFVDIRPINTQWKNLSIIRGDVLHMPYSDSSLESVSTLHVIEHIGLGRYGDPIDKDGTKKAAKELIRVLKPGGKLYVSLPLGRYRICFNAHRVHTFSQIQEYFKPLTLVEFSFVDDEGIFHSQVNPKDYKHLNYGCGMYLFTKKV